MPGLWRDPQARRGLLRRAAPRRVDRPGLRARPRGPAPAGRGLCPRGASRRGAAARDDRSGGRARDRQPWADAVRRAGLVADRGKCRRGADGSCRSPGSLKAFATPTVEAVPALPVRPPKALACDADQRGRAGFAGTAAQGVRSRRRPERPCRLCRYGRPRRSLATPTREAVPALPVRPPKALARDADQRGRAGFAGAAVLSRGALERALFEHLPADGAHRPLHLVRDAEPLEQHVRLNRGVPIEPPTVNEDLRHRLALDPSRPVGEYDAQKGEEVVTIWRLAPGLRLSSTGCNGASGFSVRWLWPGSSPGAARPLRTWRPRVSRQAHPPTVSPRRPGLTAAAVRAVRSARRVWPSPPSSCAVVPASSDYPDGASWRASGA